MFNEWELLVLADDVQPGDSLSIEDDSGNSETMTFVKNGPKNTVILKDANGDLLTFSAANLEEVRGYRYIIGKDNEEKD